MYHILEMNKKKCKKKNHSGKKHKEMRKYSQCSIKWESQDIKCTYDKEQFGKYTYHYLYLYIESEGGKKRKSK